MTITQGLLSIIIIGHVLAMTVGAVPGLDDFGADTTAPRPLGPTLRSKLTSLLDRVSVPAVRAHRIVYALTAPLHRPVRFYLDITDQYSKWNMFSRPARTSEYVRLHYTFVRSDGTTGSESELVYPAAEPGHWRLLTAYFDSFLDKAFANGNEAYRMRAAAAAQRGQPRPGTAMREDLLPFVRHYSRRRLTALPDGTRLTRAEFWYGTAPSPPPGAELPAQTLRARDSALPGTEGNDVTWELWLVDDDAN